MRPRTLAPLLLCSGAAALVLEVCWFRRMAQVAGGPAVAMAAAVVVIASAVAVVAAFAADSAAMPGAVVAPAEPAPAAGH